MKIACQTIVWGTRLEDPVEVFKTIYELGFEGVEIAQPPSELPKPNELKAILEHLGLTFLGFYGGSLHDRMKYCARYKPKYLAINDWEGRPCGEAFAREFNLALHPHMYYRNCDLRKAAEVLDDRPRLQFLPDVAHLFLGRSNPIEAITRYKDRLAAIHLKDWTPKYGRSFHRYARGFVELGRGDIPLEEVLTAIKDIGFNGWLIVEQDWTDSDPRTSYEISAQWLRKWGVKIEPRKPKEGIPRPSSRTRPPESSARTAPLAHTLMRVRRQRIPKFWNTVLEGFASLIPCKVATVWEFSRTRGLLALLASWPPKLHYEQPFVMGQSAVLSGFAIDSQMVRHLDPSKTYGEFPDEVRVFAHKELVGKYHLSRMISIPVRNTYNLNHVELVINLYPKNKRAEYRLSDDELAVCANNVAIAYEALLDDACQSAAAEVNLAVRESTEPGPWLDQVVRITESALNCEAVSVFLVDPTGTKLHPRASTGLEWRPGTPTAKQYYTKGKGLTGRAWGNCEPLMSEDPPNEPGFLGKSHERTREGRANSIVIKPLLGPYLDPMGVIRCINKRMQKPSPAVNIFSESDLAILDAIEQAAIPHLKVLLADEQRKKSLKGLGHQIKRPIAPIGLFLEYMKTLLTSGKTLDSKQLIKEIQKCQARTKVLQMISDTVTSQYENIKPQPRPINLTEELLTPLNEILNVEAQDSEMTLCCKNLSSRESVSLDTDLISQVITILALNAFKYGKDGSTVHLKVEDTPDGIEFSVSNIGEEIPTGEKGKVFEWGYRAPDILEKRYPGAGVGLTLAQHIARSMKTKIYVKQTEPKTVFAFELKQEMTSK